MSLLKLFNHIRLSVDKFLTENKPETGKVYSHNLDRQINRVVSGLPGTFYSLSRLGIAPILEFETVENCTAYK